MINKERRNGLTFGRVILSQSEKVSVPLPRGVGWRLKNLEILLLLAGGVNRNDPGNFSNWICNLRFFEKKVGFLKRSFIFFKIGKSGKFVAQCVSNGTIFEMFA